MTNCTTIDPFKVEGSTESDKLVDLIELQSQEQSEICKKQDEIAKKTKEVLNKYQ